MLRCICGFLTLVEHVSLFRVCKQLRDLAQQPSAWSSVTLCLETALATPDWELLCRFFRNLCQTPSATISCLELGFKPFHRELPAQVPVHLALHRWSALHTLHLERVVLSASSLQALSQAQQLKHLNWVSMSQSPRLPSSLSSLAVYNSLGLEADFLTHCAPSLTALSLHRHFDVSFLSALTASTKLVHFQAHLTPLADLNPLRHCRLLETLVLTHATVTCIQPLAGCDRLRYVSLVHSRVQALEAARHWPLLEELNVSNTHVSDLSPLSACGQLRWLSMSGTAATELTALSACRDLRVLHAAGTGLTELHPLRDCAWLQELNLSRTVVSSLEPLSHCVQLERLDLSHTAVSDLAPLSGCHRLRRLWLQGTKISDLSVASQFHSLVDLDVCQTPVSDLEPLSACTQLLSLGLAKTSVTRLTPLWSCAQLFHCSVSVSALPWDEFQRLVAHLPRLRICRDCIHDDDFSAWEEDKDRPLQSWEVEDCTLPDTRDWRAESDAGITTQSCALRAKQALPVLSLALPLVERGEYSKRLASLTTEFYLEAQSELWSW